MKKKIWKMKFGLSHAAGLRGLCAGAGREWPGIGTRRVRYLGGSVGEAPEGRASRRGRQQTCNSASLPAEKRFPGS